jgi:hypothetical protein
MAEPLSGYLLERIRELDDDGDDEELAGEEQQEARKLVDIVTRALLESRLALTDKLAVRAMEALFAGNREMLSDMFDDHYTRFFVRNVPKYVRRTVKLVSLVVKNVPSNEVRLYLHEAGRSFVFGHWLSSIALARATLETSLRNCIQAAGATPDRELQMLIDTAGKLKLLDGQHRYLARQIQRSGNAIIHAAPKDQPTEQTSFDTLVALRGVLLYLYKDAGA